MNDPSVLNSSQGKYADVNGLQVYYEVHGAGIPIILLHGRLATCRMWDPAIFSLSENYQTITPDSCGHGRTDNPSGKFSYPLMAADTR